MLLGDELAERLVRHVSAVQPFFLKYDSTYEIVSRSVAKALNT